MDNHTTIEKVLTRKHKLDDFDSKPIMLKVHVLDDDNNPTEEIKTIDMSKIYSIKCKCGQSKIMCQLINPLCNQYCCSDRNNCPDFGEIKVVPKKDEQPTLCQKCGKKMEFWGGYGSLYNRGC